MPVTKQAIKRMKQTKVRAARNRHYSSEMKSMVKLLLGYVKTNEIEKAEKVLPKVVKAIDNAAKKNLIHGNNASRKKSRVQKAVNALKAGTEKKEAKKGEVKSKKTDEPKA
jgi:small subunit ribosomal protein S20